MCHDFSPLRLMLLFQEAPINDQSCIHFEYRYCCGLFIVSIHQFNCIVLNEWKTKKKKNWQTHWTRLFFFSFSWTKSILFTFQIFYRTHTWHNHCWRFIFIFFSCCCYALNNYNNETWMNEWMLDYQWLHCCMILCVK